MDTSSSPSFETGEMDDSGQTENSFRTKMYNRIRKDHPLWKDKIPPTIQEWYAMNRNDNNQILSEIKKIGHVMFYRQPPRNYTCSSIDLLRRSLCCPTGDVPEEKDTCDPYNTINTFSVTYLE